MFKVHQMSNLILSKDWVYLIELFKDIYIEFYISEVVQKS